VTRPITSAAAAAAKANDVTRREKPILMAVPPLMRKLHRWVTYITHFDQRWSSPNGSIPHNPMLESAAFGLVPTGLIVREASLAFTAWWIRHACPKRE
jgi:hypothetical protein